MKQKIKKFKLSHWNIKEVMPFKLKDLYNDDIDEILFNNGKIYIFVKSLVFTKIIINDDYIVFDLLNEKNNKIADYFIYSDDVIIARFTY